MSGQIILEKYVKIGNELAAIIIEKMNTGQWIHYCNVFSNSSIKKEWQGIYLMTMGSREFISNENAISWLAKKEKKFLTLCKG